MIDTTKMGKRERQIVDRYAHGFNTKDIAYQLGISSPTVYTHNLRVKKKYGLDTRTKWLAFLQEMKDVGQSVGDAQRSENVSVADGDESHKIQHSND